jgi:hypothetical protein
MLLDVLSEVNWLAVLVAAVAYFAVGGLWYSPVLFAKPWIASSGITPEQAQGPGALYAVSFGFQFLASLALALIAVAAGAESVADGIVLGLVVGIGFVLTSVGVTQMFSNAPGVLQAINIGYHLVGLVVAGIIVALWR